MVREAGEKIVIDTQHGMDIDISLTRRTKIDCKNMDVLIKNLCNLQREKKRFCRDCLQARIRICYAGYISISRFLTATPMYRNVMNMIIKARDVQYRIRVS